MQEINPNFTNINNNYPSNKIKLPFDKGDHIYSFKKNLKINGCNSHPHNFLFQFFAETGIFGALFYISGIIFC